MTQEVLYPRVCSITNEGMNKGFVYHDGDLYFKYEKDLISHIRSLGNEEFNNVSDEFILKESYEAGEYYWTEWEDLSEENELYDEEGNIIQVFKFVIFV